MAFHEDSSQVIHGIQFLERDDDHITTFFQSDCDQNQSTLLQKEFLKALIYQFRICGFNIKMGSGLSQEANTQQPEFSPTNPASKTHENLQTTKAKATTTSTRLNPLPHDCEAILKDADTVIDKSSIDQLYAGVFLNQKRKKYWVDKASYANCFLVFAKDLSITWAEDNRYWHWTSIKETSEMSIDVAEMLSVCWLEVAGKFETARLTPGIRYEVVFVVMLKDPAYGWEVPINVSLILPDGNKQQHKENLVEKPRSRWFEIPVGEFTAEATVGGFIEFALYEYEGGAWKRGLLVKGAAIKPKNRN